MKPIPIEARPRLAKIIRLLTSDTDAVAAASALRTALAAVGCDIHDLAAEIENGRPRADQAPHAAYYGDRHQTRRDPGMPLLKLTPEDILACVPLLKWGIEAGLIRPRKEISFVEDIIFKVENDRLRSLSRMQDSWLINILARLNNAKTKGASFA